MISIRPAAEADAPVLRLIAVAAYQHYLPRIGRPPAPMTADYAAAARRGQAWLAAENGEAAGFIILIPQPPSAGTFPNIPSGNSCRAGTAHYTKSPGNYRDAAGTASRRCLC